MPTSLLSGLIALASGLQLNPSLGLFPVRGWPHYALHLGVYAALGCFIVIANTSWNQWKLFMLLAVLSAVGAECCQSIYAGASFRWLDILTDVVGMFAGMILMFFWAIWALGRAHKSD